MDWCVFCHVWRTHTHAKFVSEIHSYVTHQTMLIILKLAPIFSDSFLCAVVAVPVHRPIVDRTLFGSYICKLTQDAIDQSHMLFATLCFFDDTRFNKFVKHLFLWTVHLLLLKCVSRISLQRNRKKKNSVIFEWKSNRFHEYTYLNWHCVWNCSAIFRISFLRQRRNICNLIYISHTSLSMTEWHRYNVKIVFACESASERGRVRKVSTFVLSCQSFGRIRVEFKISKNWVRARAEYHIDEITHMFNQSQQQQAPPQPIRNHSLRC